MVTPATMITTKDTLENGSLAWSGPVTYRTVTRLYRELQKSIEAFSGTAITIDLAAVTEIDSAGIALLVNSGLEARARNIALAFSNLNTQAQSLIKLYGVTDMVAVTR